MSIALSLGNNLTTGGIFKPAAINNTSVNNVTTFASVPGNATLNLISTQTASGSSSISFTSSIDNTYDEYIFKFYDIHPGSDNSTFSFQCSTDGGSTYGVTATTTFFGAYHNEADTATGLVYETNSDLAQSTSFQQLSFNGNQNDESSAGTIQLFNPSSTTLVKNFISTGVCNTYFDYLRNEYVAGYFNTTSAINAVQFKFTNGANIDNGIIKMYGVTKS